jgi:hypothetical protein
MEDLFKALQMFKQGVGELQLSRAIAGANEQVSQIKASELDEQKQRSALQDVSNQLVGRLSQLGTPATTIAQMAGAVGPKQFASPDQMFVEASLSNDQGLRKQAQQAQSDINNPKLQMQLLKASMAGDNSLKAQQFKALQDERWAKHVEALDKRIDTQTARFGNIGKLQQVNNSIADARVVLSGDIYNLNVAEMAKTLDRILSQASPTISGTAEVTPQTLKQMLAKTKEFVSSKPQKVDIPEFINFYKKTLDRIEQVNNGIITTAQKNIVKGLGGQIAPEFRERYLGYINDKLGVEAEYNPKGSLQFKDKPAQQQAAPTQTAPAMINPDGTPMEMRTAKDNITGLPVTVYVGSDGNIYKP